jgi:hypothetical protein
VPAPVRAYFEALRADDDGAVLALFAPDAVVVDREAEIRGAAEIREWQLGPVAANDATIELLGGEPLTGGGYQARVRMTGSFPGGVAEALFDFRSSDGKISRLEISPL